jgi:Fic family protein
MKYTPPFKVTTKIIDLISKISLNIGKLEAIDSTSTLPMLRKVNQIRTITGTLQIEGNTLDEERITALIEGKRVLGKVDEIAEANGAIALYKMLDNLNFKDEKELLKSHKILMDDTIKDLVWKGKDMSIYTMRNIVNKIRQKTYYEIVRNHSSRGYTIDILKNKRAYIARNYCFKRRINRTI